MRASTTYARSTGFGTTVLAPAGRPVTVHRIFVEAAGSNASAELQTAGGATIATIPLVAGNVYDLEVRSGDGAQLVATDLGTGTPPAILATFG